jgi:hypothetical protein
MIERTFLPYQFLLFPCRFQHVSISAFQILPFFFNHGFHGWTQISNFCFQILAAPTSDAGGSEFQLFQKLPLPDFRRTLAAWQRIVSTIGTAPFMRETATSNTWLFLSFL